jgi:small subunit ribosomal protein S6
MRDYEVAFIAQPDLDEASLNTLIEKTKGWITNSGGQVVKVDAWGRRKLAYSIRKQSEGQYVFITANLAPAATREIERNMRFTEQILRFLIVRADE